MTDTSRAAVEEMAEQLDILAEQGRAFNAEVAAMLRALLAERDAAQQGAHINAVRAVLAFHRGLGALGVDFTPATGFAGDGAISTTLYHEKRPWGEVSAHPSGMVAIYAEWNGQKVTVDAATPTEAAALIATLRSAVPGSAPTV